MVQRYFFHTQNKEKGRNDPSCCSKKCIHCILPAIYTQKLGCWVTHFRVTCLTHVETPWLCVCIDIWQLKIPIYLWQLNVCVWEGGGGETGESLCIHNISESWNPCFYIYIYKNIFWLPWLVIADSLTLMVRSACRSVTSWWYRDPCSSWPSRIHLTLGLGFPVKGILIATFSPFSNVHTSRKRGGTLILGGAETQQHDTEVELQNKRLT